MAPKNFFIRNLQAEDFQEAFLIASITTIFGIRIFLYLTDYPQLGGAGLHIAHMLWGGFFMVIALIILMSFLSKSATMTAAILGGIGFGSFIDELGKFVTSDNNYFFEPTVALMYIIFIILYLSIRSIPKVRITSQREYLINAIEMIKEAVINDLDIEEEKQARAYLAACDPKDPVVRSLTKLLDEFEVLPTPPPSSITKIKNALKAFYLRVAQSQIIARSIVFIQILQSIVTVSFMMQALFDQKPLTFDEYGMLISSVLAAVCILYGLFSLRISRKKAYMQFKFAVLVNIFLTQFFMFYRSQFPALSGLVLNIIILLVINYVLYLEENRTGTKDVKYVLQ